MLCDPGFDTQLYNPGGVGGRVGGGDGGLVLLKLVDALISTCQRDILTEEKVVVLGVVCARAAF